MSDAQIESMRGVVDDINATVKLLDKIIRGNGEVERGMAHRLAVVESFVRRYAERGLEDRLDTLDERITRIDEFVLSRQRIERMVGGFLLLQFIGVLMLMGMFVTRQMLTASDQEAWMQQVNDRIKLIDSLEMATDR